MDAADFLVDENWHGGYYELAIDLGRRSDPDSDGRVSAALATLWSDPRLEGCYLDRWRRRTDQERVEPKLTDPEEPHPLYGVAHLPGGGDVVCVTHIVRENSGDAPQDWIDLSLPTGALGQVDKRLGGYPFEEDDSSLTWRAPIDEWFVSIAASVFEVAPFKVALIGCEVSGDPAAETFGAGLPDERWIGYVIPHGDAVRFVPPTH